MEGIPQDVELMANELVRVCAKHHVALTAFAFRAGDKEAKQQPFVFHFGTIMDNYENIRKTNDMCIDLMERAQPERKILRKNDA